MNKFEFEMTEKEFVDSVLEEIGKSSEDFTTPLIEDKEFILEAIRCYSNEICDELMYRISNKLLEDEEIWEELYKCDPESIIEFYSNLIPAKLWKNPRFISALARHNSRIIQEAPAEGKDESTIYEAIGSIEENYDSLEYADEFMYISSFSPTELWKNKCFVYEMIGYAKEYLSDVEEERAKEFFDLIPLEFWNDKDFVLELLEDDTLIFIFGFIQEYISKELRQNEEIAEKLEEYE